jgi:hypothetical protein
MRFFFLNVFFAKIEARCVFIWYFEEINSFNFFESFRMKFADMASFFNGTCLQIVFCTQTKITKSGGKVVYEAKWLVPFSYINRKAL